MVKFSILIKKKNKKTNNVEWALVSKKNNKVLKWFGKKKPSEERVLKEEKRIQFFKHQSDRMEKIIKIGNMIGFPEEEWEELRGNLNQKKYQYTTRIKNELNKYKEGESYKTPWGDGITIINKKKYNDIKDHPFFDFLTEEQINQIGDEEFEVLKFKLSNRDYLSKRQKKDSYGFGKIEENEDLSLGPKEEESIGLAKKYLGDEVGYCNDVKISKRDFYIKKEAIDPAKKTAESLFKIIEFLAYRIPNENKRKYLNRVRGKVVKISPYEIGYKKMSPSAVVGQAVSFSKNLLSGLNPNFIKKVLEELVKMMIEEKFDAKTF